LSPHFTPAAVNLADLYRALDRDGEGAALLQEALELSPNDGGLHHALGLALVRLKKPAEATKSLRRAAELEPGRARYAYVYAVGLESVGRRAEAIAALEEPQAPSARPRPERADRRAEAQGRRRRRRIAHVARCGGRESMRGGRA
jgi:Flp pilus assembly protein TadD